MRTLWYKNFDDANDCAMTWSSDRNATVRVFANDDRTRFYVECGPSFPMRNESILAIWKGGKRQQKAPTYAPDKSHLDRE